MTAFKDADRVGLDGVIIVAMYRTFRDEDGFLISTVTERRIVTGGQEVIQFHRRAGDPLIHPASGHVDPSRS